MTEESAQFHSNMLYRPQGMYQSVRDSMLIVGITGRSGSGKSVVSRHYAAKGYPVADGDELSRYATRPGNPCLAELTAAFGSDILAADGSLNRRRLGELAFASKAKTSLLTAITHPYILEEMLARAQRARTEGARLFFVDGAVIVGGIFEEYCDKLIVVVSERRLAVSRIILRDGISKTAASARLEAQQPEEVMLAAADYVIDNNASEEMLLGQAEDVLRRLLAGC